MNIGFLTIHVRDINASVEFYEKVLGMKVTRRFSPRPGMEIVFLSDDKGGTVEFIGNEKEKVFSAEGLSLGFYIEDMDKTVAHLKAHNVPILYGPTTTPDGTKLLSARDINGMELGFVQMPLR
jgi:lactoylglutathione lyase